MRLHRVFADGKRLRDVAVGEAAAHAVEHFGFAVREVLPFRQLHQPSRRRLRDVAAAGMHAVDRAHEFLARHALLQIAGRAGFDRALDVVVEFRGREHQHASLRPRRKQRAERVEAAHAGHAHIHEHDIGPLGAEFFERLRAVFRFGDDGKILLETEHGGQAHAHHGVIVDQENPDTGRVSHQRRSMPGPARARNRPNERYRGPCRAPRRLRRHGVPRVFAAFVAVLLAGAASAPVRAAEPAPLTACAEVRALPRDAAMRGLPVRVRGTVTLLPADAAGSFVLDDGTGIWIGPRDLARPDDVATRLRLGDLVEVAGRTHEGHFAPTVSADEVRVVGRAPLPASRPLTQLGLDSGRHDSQRVSTTGVVQAAEIVERGDKPALNLLVSTASGQLNFLLYHAGTVPPAALVDSEVEVTGVFLSYFNSRREFLGVRIFSNDPADLRILRAPEADAFAAPAVTLGDAMGFSSSGMDAHRRRVRGTVTLCKPGHYFYIQAGQHALRINTRQPDALAPGDIVEATGFFRLEHHRSEMHEALFRRLGREAPPEPEEITREQAFVREPRVMYTIPQDYDDFLVALRGRLVSFDHKKGEPLRLNLECDGVLVPAEFTVAQDPSVIAALRPDSELRVSGICALTFSQSRPVTDWPAPVALRLLLRGPADVQVIEAAPWWTPERLWAALGLTAAGFMGVLAWVVLLRRQVARRSTQLAEEMRARRDAAVEFESTLRERNRLAADLHDTTEQSLTGLAFQLEATEALRGRAPERSLQHLALARQLLGRSREDLRRSIWNLRANPLEKNTLSEALREVAADRSAGLPVRIVVACAGTERALPDFVAGNLLLLAQEGITNALKHAKPAEIELRLTFAERAITLVIRDDGSGFDPATADGPKDGHFGLQGMRERIKRLGGRLELASTPGQGTTITATVPQ